MPREGHRPLPGHPHGVLQPDAEGLAVDPAVADGQHHAGRDLLDLLLDVDHRVASRNRRLLSATVASDSPCSASTSRKPWNISSSLWKARMSVAAEAMRTLGGSGAGTAITPRPARASRASAPGRRGPG